MVQLLYYFYKKKRPYATSLTDFVFYYFFLASSATELNVTTSATPQSLPVRLFPAFGNSSNDCSVRFSSTKHEQTGFWTCAARKKSSDSFTSTEPAKLSIATDNPGSLNRIRWIDDWRFVNVSLRSLILCTRRKVNIGDQCPDIAVRDF